MLNVTALIRFLIFFVLVVFSFSLELLFSKLYYKLTNEPYKKHHYSFGKYVYFLVLPILIVLYFTKGNELNFMGVFIGFAVLGTLAEWVIGFFYHMIVGQRLWTYHRYSITGYTSFLSIPIWGLSGLIFSLFIKIFV